MVFIFLISWNQLPSTIIHGMRSLNEYRGGAYDQTISLSLVVEDLVVVIVVDFIFENSRREPGRTRPQRNDATHPVEEEEALAFLRSGRGS